MGKVRYMDNDRWRPIYRYPYGNDIVYLVSSIAAIGTSIGMYLALYGAIQVSAGLFWILEAVLLAGGLIAGFVVARYLFFVTPQVRRTSATIWAACACFHFFGLYMLSPRSGTAANMDLITGIALLAIAYADAGIALKKCGWIRLYTDGVVIGRLVIKYADFVYTEFATGKPYTDHVPEQAKGKPLVLLTPIDYEYIERYFGVSHYYCFIITKDKAYVAQSLTGRSDFAANVRNAWACYDWNQRQKAKKGEA